MVWSSDFGYLDIIWTLCNIVYVRTRIIMIKLNVYILALLFWERFWSTRNVVSKPKNLSEEPFGPHVYLGFIPKRLISGWFFSSDKISILIYCSREPSVNMRCLNLNLTFSSLKHSHSKLPFQGRPNALMTDWWLNLDSKTWSTVILSDNGFKAPTCQINHDSRHHILISDFIAVKFSRVFRLFASYLPTNVNGRNRQEIDKMIS